MEYVTTINSLDNSSFASDDVTDATTELDYEMDDPLEFSDIAHLVLMYGTTFLLGVVGHILVIFTVAQQRPKNKHTVTNIFLTSLASADLLLILICVPLKVSSRSRPPPDHPKIEVRQTHVKNSHSRRENHCIFIVS